jgi:hypothetical protein
MTQTFTVRASEVVWHGASGSAPADPRTVYTLLGSGFSSMPTSENINELVNRWVAAHPNAELIRVVNFGPLMKNRTDSQLIWVWLVDGSSNLNLELVREGACSANAMTAEERVRVLVPLGEYAQFQEELPRLEQLAKHDKLGIWK